MSKANGGPGSSKGHGHNPVKIVPVTGNEVPASVETAGLTMTQAYQPLGKVLFGDQTDEKIHLLTDRNGDGDTADAGEQRTFFDGTNASGLPDPTANIFNIHQASRGDVYAGDGDTDSVYRLVDRNRDGDANDAGEATVWFSEANAHGFTLPTPNGIAQGRDGAIYVVNAGVASRPADAIYRTVDRNGDGDANDAGESSLWLDLQTVNASSSAFDLSFIGDVAYLTDTNGGTPDTVYRIQDRNRNGVIDDGEATVFISDTESFGAPIDIANAAQGKSILTYTWIGNESDPPRVFRLTDLNRSGTIDSPREAEEVWNWDYMPDGFEASVGFSIAADKNGDVVITTNGTGPETKNVVRLTDLNGDGDYIDAGETVIALSNGLDGDIAGRPRAVAFYGDGKEQDHPLVYREGGPGAKLASDLSIDDPDSSVLSGATVGIVGGLDKRADILTVDIPQGSSIRAAYDANKGILTIAGAGTEAEYEEVLQTLAFESRTDNPSEHVRRIQITVYDERGLKGEGAEIATTIGVEADRSIRTVFGTDRSDKLSGSKRADQLLGLDGDDKIFAFDGDDVLSGGAGDDLLGGGKGRDTFIFRADSERDVITDFDLRQDKILFEGVTLDGEEINSLKDAAGAAKSIGRGDLEYTFDNGATLVLLDQHHGHAFV